MSSRSARRRRGESPNPPRRRPRFLPVVALGVAAAIAAVVVVLVLFVFGGGDDDEDKIESLARLSIEVLPAGEWPSLYESFTREFQQRCSRQEFEQAGEDAATELGDDLPFLRFKRVENIDIEGQNARAVIVGQLAGQPEYSLRAAFRMENGDWKLAPAPNTEGCEAFRRLG